MSPDCRGLLAAGPTYSFEFFPPKNDKELATLARTIGELQPLEPSRSSRSPTGVGRGRAQRTFDLVAGMLFHTDPGSIPWRISSAWPTPRLELPADILGSLRKAGIEEVLMALGGDPPRTPQAGPGELAYATELVELARAIGGFWVGVAAHPAGHPRSPHLESDREYLAAKLELADFGVTQFFFEVAEYEDLVSDLEARGVDKPVLPGILPVTSLSTMSRLGAMGAGSTFMDGGAAAGCRRAWWRRHGTQRRKLSWRRSCARDSCTLESRAALLHVQCIERDAGDLRTLGLMPRPA